MGLQHNDLPRKVQIGNKWVGEGQPAYFIAEIGNNHNGDFYLAKRTIDEAVKAGADAVKFQKRFVDETFAKELLEKPQVKDQIYGKTYGEYRKALELDKEEFVKLKAYTEAQGVTFFATPFDKSSADFLEEVGQDVYKIASFDVTNLPLLEHVAKKGKPVILSTGMSSLEEVDEAVETILKHNKNLIVLHCVSIYPSAEDKLNLRTIPMYQERFAPLPIGYSGHEQDYIPTLAAISLGAKCVERHITLDKAMPGPDHATVSIEPDEFKAMVAGARRIEHALGVARSEVLPDEMKTREKHSKSIVSTARIPAGTLVTENMIMAKSPGYGMKPRFIPDLIGKKVKVDIEADTVVKKEDIAWDA
ncbi:MAG: N-acetylneuraminate synthase family protein [bacterium]|nr:N-acetylneuraminate synthase family protein [bacterium]